MVTAHVIFRLNWLWGYPYELLKIADYVMIRHKDFPNPCRSLDVVLANRHFEKFKFEHVEHFNLFKLIVLCNLSQSWQYK